MTREHVRKNLNTVKAKALRVVDNRAAFWALAALLVGLFVSYSFMIHQTIRNVAERQKLETEMSVLHTKIGELEFKYISMRNDITIDRAYELGFNDVMETKFVSRKSLSSAALSRSVQ